jgi:soluble lytic murein transglycosylase
MKNQLKLYVIILIFSIFLPSQAVAADRILPIPKPTVDQETKEKTAKKKEIYPQKKPTQKIKITAEALEESTESEIIYPQKKPIIFQKKIDKAVAKSTILSSKDLKIAKAAFEAVKKKKWQTAIKISKRAKNKMVFKMVNWFYLKQPINSATFYDYLTFINNNPNYPRINRLKYLAEHKMYLKSVSSNLLFLNGVINATIDPLNINLYNIV